jgi:hypothetical protein
VRVPAVDCALALEHDAVDGNALARLDDEALAHSGGGEGPRRRAVGRGDILRQQAA